MASVATLRDLVGALIESAKEDSKLDAVVNDLERFFDFITSQENLRNILSTPAFESEEKISIIMDIGAKAGFEPYTSNFLGLVIELGKFGVLIRSREPVMRKLRKASGLVRAEITLSSQPTDEDVRRLKEAIEKDQRHKVEVAIKIDPEILGGVIAKIEGKMFDGSLRTQLNGLKETLSR